ncbi:hypothetical protein K1T71_010867 [Dendrolimus kikuchii]|uniref:Uncharacterized protein n=1 Tax=Dendrolimus kikuchii TaxID=765133 RepID=A0ACC1CQ22_9NEOP|nr:hypothetical protein K1T71_010867 [Dendrolimus kikuchii]
MTTEAVVSSFFSQNTREQDEEISDKFLHLADELNLRLEQFKIPSKVQCVYNPTIYARYTYEMYVRKYCNTKKKIMYFGMNPGPWGMSQTGVPFGEVSFVRDWLKIEGDVGKPENELKERPVQGFQCTRSEVSGKRLWGFFKDLCKTPDIFFKSSFIYNYLPQQWMKNNGCNITPGDLRGNEMEELYNICDPILCKVLELYNVDIIIAVGKFCETRAQKILKKYILPNKIQILYLPHPSPRAVNNNDWERKAHECLKKNNLLHFYQQGNDSAT